MLTTRLTLKAYHFNPSASPGTGWKRVPARETIDSVATGPGMSLAAMLMPCALPTSYWKEPRSVSLPVHPYDILFLYQKQARQGP